MEPSQKKIAPFENQARDLIFKCLQKNPKDRIAVREMRSHAFLQGGFDDRQIGQSFGALQSGLMNIQKTTKALFGHHEDRKARLKVSSSLYCSQMYLFIQKVFVKRLHPSQRLDLL